MTQITKQVQNALTKLQTLAAPYEVVFAANPNTVPVALFRISMPGDMYLEGTGKDLLASLKAGVLEDIQQTMEWAADSGLSLVPAKWRGRSLQHAFQDADGNVIMKTPAAGADMLALRRAPVRLGMLRRAALRQGFKLLDTEWIGESASYHFQKEGKTFRAPAKDFFPSTKITHALRPGTIVTTPAPVSEPPVTVKDLPKVKAPPKVSTGDDIPVHELGSNYLAGLTFERSRTSLSYIFKLPDGTKVEAAWQKMLDAVDTILDRKALDESANYELIETSDCIELRKLIVAS
jgi:hypothetical protein